MIVSLQYTTKRWAFAAAVATLVTLGTGCIETPVTNGISTHVGDWRDEIIYQVLTDRFANGDASNDYGANIADPSAYHGGDWRGIIDRLDYLEELGVTAIWISPVVKNVEMDAGFSSYHGYWTQDFGRPNPHFGDVSSLREMVDAAHERGIKVVLDIVTNHVGQAFYYDINKNGQPDDFYIGQGGVIPVGELAGSASDLTRITEWDPDFNSGGIQAWTSLGPSGPAPIVFMHDASLNRVPPEPAEIFGEPWAYHRKGRVTVWTNPWVCGCPSWGCNWENSCRMAQETLGDFPGGLKDIDTEHPKVQEALIDVFSKWIEMADFDGFRIDTLKHIEHSEDGVSGFWNNFCPRIRDFAARNGKENFFMFGEAFDGDDSLLGHYTHGEGVDSVFYFSQYYSVLRGKLLDRRCDQGRCAFEPDRECVRDSDCDSGGRTCEIERLHCRRHGCTTDPCGEGQTFPALFSSEWKQGGPLGDNGEPLNSRQLVVNFESNHDVGRLLFFMPPDWDEAMKRAVLQQGLTYLLMTDGIPALYYGVEQEFAGGNDPANRETMWDPGYYMKSVWDDELKTYVWANKTYDSNGDGVDDTLWEPYDTGNPTFKHVKNLINIRKMHSAIRHGTLRTRWSTPGGGGEDHGIYAFERSDASETVLVVLNLSSERQSHTSTETSTMTVSFSPGSTVVDLLDPTTVYTVSDQGCTIAEGQDEGCLDVSVGARKARILVRN